MLILQMLTSSVLGDSPAIGPRDQPDSRSPSPVRMRRRWVFRTSSLLLATAVGLCIVVIWQRDKYTVSETLKQLEPIAAALQSNVNDIGWLPARVPQEAMDKARVNLSWYATDDVRLYAANTTEPVLVAHTLEIELHLHHNGVCAIVYDDGKVQARWLTMAEFRQFRDEQQERLDAFEAERRARPPQLPE